ncbi:sensor domain-containing protein [Idiomarina sp. UBA3162]|uniref:sensor domain-containing protein n=1 Tax=Idiomarina sp. UBA3162 TaxID=1946641 RepID=UPI000C8C3009|nr:EAL domain-containing protein [Idiomarina sp. UBA3162]MAD54238.1 hypothetical protein [Idiomarinaceae bacterium]
MGKNPIETKSKKAIEKTHFHWLAAYALTTTVITVLAVSLLYLYPFDVQTLHFGVMLVGAIIIAESTFFIWRALRASKTMIKSLQPSINQLDEGSTIVYELHKQGNTYQPVYVSRNIKQILGYSVEESMGPSWWFDNVHPEDRALTLSALTKVEANHTFVHRYRFRTKQGHYIWLRDELRTFHDDNDKIAGQWSDISHDLSWLQDNQAITQRELIGFAELNDDDSILRADTNFRNLIGLTDNEPSAHHILDFISPTNFNNDNPTLEAGIEYLVEFNRPNHQALHGLLKISEDKQGAVRFVTLIDLSAFASERRRLKQIAYIQPLTGLPNLEQLKLDLQSSLDRANEDELVAVLNINIREFHKVNDSYGVTNGDRVLQRVAQRFQQALPDNAGLYCAWGDDFWILLSGIKEYMDLQDLMDDLMSALNKPLMLEKHIQLQVTANIGACTYPLDGLDTASLLSYASSALQRARRKPYSSQVIFNQQMASDSFSQLLVKQQLQRALDHSQFEVYYQPISDFDKHIQGYEALLRWHHEDEGIIPASDFLHSCDKSVKQRLGQWVIETVFNDLASIPVNADEKRKVTINLFTEQLDMDFVQQMKKTQDRIKALNAELCFELKEASLIDPSDELRTTLNALAAANFSLIIDDFGAGFAGLTYLREFPISAIKVDRDFMATLDNERGYAIVDGIVELSHRAGIKVHALGIESEHQFALAKQLRFDVCQGRFIHPAKPLNKLVANTNQ